MGKANITLSRRLEAVVSMVTGSKVICDIGCDHGLVSICLIVREICPRVIAMDVNQGPLQAARENIRVHGLEAYIETRLSDGLENLKEKEAEGLICAGMGGGLICRILEAGAGIAAQMKELILQPQSQLEETRSYLASRGFRIEDEKMIFEDGKYYPIIRAVPTDSTVRNSAAENRYGPVLIRKKDPVLIEYLRRERRISLEILENLQKAAKQSSEKECSGKKEQCDEIEPGRQQEQSRQQERSRIMLETIREIDLILQRMEARDEV